MMIRARWRSFKDIYEKAAFMQEGARRDAGAPLVLAAAATFRGIPDAWQRARAILRFCQYCIEYVRDPGIEVLDSSEVGLMRGFGDCDLKSRLCVALMLATGLQAEIEPVFVDDTFPHVRARVHLDGKWWRMDPSILNSDIGVIPRTGIVTNRRSG